MKIVVLARVRVVFNPVLVPEMFLLEVRREVAKGQANSADNVHR